MLYIVSGELIPESNKIYQGRMGAMGNIIGFIAEKTNSIKIYEEISMQIVSGMSVEEKYNIRLDTNPKLFKALRTNLRSRKISAKLKQVESKGSSLI